MDEMIKLWLEELYRSEIAEAKADIFQEETFASGCPLPADKAMHEENIEELNKYIEVLEELIMSL